MMEQRTLGVGGQGIGQSPKAAYQHARWAYALTERAKQRAPMAPAPIVDHA